MYRDANYQPFTNTHPSTHPHIVSCHNDTRRPSFARSHAARDGALARRLREKLEPAARQLGCLGVDGSMDLYYGLTHNMVYIYIYHVSVYIIGYHINALNEIDVSINSFIFYHIISCHIILYIHIHTYVCIYIYICGMSCYIPSHYIILRYVLSYQIRSDQIRSDHISHFDSRYEI